MNTDDKFCIQITPQSVNFKENSFRLLQGHCEAWVIPHWAWGRGEHATGTVPLTAQAPLLL